jgi:membrane protease subunit HflK
MPQDPQHPARPGEGGPRRSASVTLRADGAGASQLDPANQSLADALSLVFRILQLGMIVLIVAFVASGFSSVAENEKGIKLLFGRQTGRDLPPGPYFSAPLPLGELVKIKTGQEGLEIDDTYWQQMDATTKKLSIQDAARMGKPSLKPGEDGSLLTGDSNLAHTQWSVRYHRENASEYAQNILPDAEKDIVQSAVERGIVQAVAQVTIDDLLKQAGNDQGSIATRAKELAQQSLDSIHSGLKIEQVALKEKSPPFNVYSAFTNVQSAEQNAGAAREKAQSDARNDLSAAAGLAYEPLIKLIDQYEQAVTRGDAAAQGEVMGKIHAVFQGQEIKIGDQSFRAHLVAGQVTQIMNDAEQYRLSVQSQRQAELTTFRGKLAQFKSNPDLVIKREWADAMGVFLNRPLVEIFNLPAGQVAELWLNRDPEFERSAREAARRKKNLDSEEVRRQEQQREFYKTRTDVKTVDSK